MPPSKRNKHIGTCMKCGRQEETKDSYPRIICSSCKKTDAYLSESSMSEQWVGFECQDE